MDDETDEIGSYLVRAATLMPLRLPGEEGTGESEDGEGVEGVEEMEILVCQNEIADLVRSEPGRYAFHSFPGELRFFGGQRLAKDESPLETLVGQLLGLGFPSRDPRLRAYLFNRVRFRSPGRSRVYDVFSYVAFTKENPGLLEPDLDLVNGELERRRQRTRRLIESGRWWRLSRAERLAHAGSKIRSVLWMRVRDLLKMYAGKASERPSFVNEWQRREMEEWGCVRTPVVYGFVEPLVHLMQLGSRRAIVAAALETRVLRKRVDAARRLSKSSISTSFTSTTPKHAGEDSRRDGSEKVEGGEEEETTMQSPSQSKTPKSNSTPSSSPSPSSSTTLPATKRGRETLHAATTTKVSMSGLRMEAAQSRAASMVRVLSLNLNILPFGVTLFGTGQGLDADRRMNEFVERLKNPGDSVDVPPGGYGVLVLQEVFATPFLPHLCRQRSLVQKLRDAGYVHVVRATRPSLVHMALSGKWTDSGLIVASKWPIVAAESMLFSTSGRSLDAGACKGALFARVETAPGVCLDVITCHLQATHTTSTTTSIPGVFSSITHIFLFLLLGLARLILAWLTWGLENPRHGAAAPEEFASAATNDRRQGKIGPDPEHWGAWMLAKLCFVQRSPRAHRSRITEAAAAAAAADPGREDRRLRSEQLQELVRFVRTVTHSSAYPWILSGDFNVDAIAQDPGVETGLHLISSGPASGESDDYVELMHALHPTEFGAGELVDLLWQKYKRHVPTRPPRYKFPRSIAYLFRHKFPQRLDYVFFRGAALGQLRPRVEETKVVEFASLSNNPSSSSLKPTTTAPSLSSTSPTSSPSPPVATHSDSTPQNNDLEREHRSHQDRPGRQRNVRFLSDHFGISIALQREVGWIWEDRAEGTPVGVEHGVEVVEHVSRGKDSDDGVVDEDDWIHEDDGEKIHSTESERWRLRSASEGSGVEDARSRAFAAEVVASTRPGAHRRAAQIVAPPPAFRPRSSTCLPASIAPIQDEVEEVCGDELGGRGVGEEKERGGERGKWGEVGSGEVGDEKGEAGGGGDGDGDGDGDGEDDEKSGEIEFSPEAIEDLVEAEEEEDASSWEEKLKDSSGSIVPRVESTAWSLVLLGLRMALLIWLMSGVVNAISASTRPIFLAIALLSVEKLIDEDTPIAVVDTTKIPEQSVESARDAIHGAAIASLRRLLHPPPLLVAIFSILTTLVLAVVISWFAWAWGDPRRAWSYLWRSLVAVTTHARLPRWSPALGQFGLQESQTQKSACCTRRKLLHHTPQPTPSGTLRSASHARRIRRDVHGSGDLVAVPSARATWAAASAARVPLPHAAATSAHGLARFLFGPRTAMGTLYSIRVPLQDYVHLSSKLPIPSPSLRQLSAPRGESDSAASKDSLGGSMPLPQTAYELAMQAIKLHGFRDWIGTRPQRTGSDEAAATIASGFQWLSYAEVMARATVLGSGLRRLTAAVPGTHVGLLAGNSVEWVEAELACRCFSLVTVILHAPSPALLDAVLDAADVEVLICDRVWVPAILRHRRKRPSARLRAIVQTSSLYFEEMVQSHQAGVYLHAMPLVRAAGRAYPLQHIPPRPESLAHVSFAWDARLRPSLVLHSERALVSEALRLRSHPVIRTLTQADVHLSFLPLAFAPERTFLRLASRLGMSVALLPPQDLANLATRIAQARPTVISSTPRILHTLALHFAQARKSWHPAYRWLFGSALAARMRWLQHGRALGPHPTPSLLPLTVDAMSREVGAWAETLVFPALGQSLGTSEFRCMLLFGATLPSLTLRPVARDLLEAIIGCPIVEMLSIDEAGVVLSRQKRDDGLSQGSESQSQPQSQPQSGPQSGPQSELHSSSRARPLRGVVGHLLPGFQAALYPCPGWIPTVGERSEGKEGDGEGKGGDDGGVKDARGLRSKSVFVSAFQRGSDGEPATSGHASLLLPGSQVHSVTCRSSGSSLICGELVLLRQSTSSSTPLVSAQHMGEVGLRIETTDPESGLGIHPVLRESSVVDPALDEATESSAPLRTGLLVVATSQPPTTPPSPSLPTSVPLALEEPVEILGSTASLVQHISGECTVLERLEMELLHGCPLARQLCLVPDPEIHGSFTAFISVHHEAAFLWSAERASKLGFDEGVGLDVKDLCERKSVREHVLSQLQETALAAHFRPWEVPVRVLLSSRPFGPREQRATPTGQMCRDEIARAVAARIQREKEE